MVESVSNTHTITRQSLQPQNQRAISSLFAAVNFLITSRSSEASASHVSKATRSAEGKMQAHLDTRNSFSFISMTRLEDVNAPRDLPDV
jgi:hypothetical protein